MNRRRPSAVESVRPVGLILAGSALALVALLCMSDADAQERTIPTALPPIVLPLNGRPVEVSEEELPRYVCAEGRMVATVILGGRAAKRIELRCIAD